MVSELHKLQELDWEIDRQRSALLSVEDRLRDNSELSQARSHLKEQEESIEQTRKHHAGKDTETGEIQEKIKTLEGKLYGGEVRSPREMESLDHELQYCRERAQELEDELLALMISLEDGEKETLVSRETVSRIETGMNTAKASLVRERDSLLKQLGEMDTQRTEASSRSNPQHIVRYERLRINRQGHAVAKVEQGMCQGCRLTIPTHELQRVRAAEDLVTCNSCGRILYLS